VPARGVIFRTSVVAAYLRADGLRLSRGRYEALFPHQYVDLPRRFQSEVSCVFVARKQALSQDKNLKLDSGSHEGVIGALVAGNARVAAIDDVFEHVLQRVRIMSGYETSG
jgi:hypothetical protein